MKTPIIKTLVSALIKGVPLLRSTKELFTKPEEIKEGEQQEKEPLAEKILLLIVEAGAVYLVTFGMKKAGLTMEDLTTIFGLFN